MSDSYQERKRLTFEQAEGAEPLPTQLQLKEVSQELRALLWEVVYKSIAPSPPPVGRPVLSHPWDKIYYQKHVFRDHKPADEFRNETKKLIDELKIIFFQKYYYLEILGFVQWLLRESACPSGLADQVEGAFRRSRAAYAVFEGDTIIPVGSDAERDTLARAFADVASSEFHGARTHLRNAGSELTAGNYPESIRESIHAVESVARVLEPGTKTLGPALGKLERSVRIHPALRIGFDKLYSFANDESGIRHALLDEPVAQVDETDALYMLGSCAAFVSYLINKARGSGLIA